MLAGRHDDDDDIYIYIYIYIYITPPHKQDASLTDINSEFYIK